MRDKVLLSSVPLEARVGCTEEERSASQPILVDIELGCDVAAAATDDALHLAVDYVAVRSETVSVVAGQAFALVETVAERIADRLLERFPVSEVMVRVKKPRALAEFGVPWVGVEIVRSRGG